MINKEQLQKIAATSGLGLYQQEKDYLLKLFLYYYYKQFNDAVFKGGTCLKYIYNLNRFSEDLDFNINNQKLFQEQIKQTLKHFEKIGISYYFIKEESFKDAYTCEIGFHGPLYDGTNQTQNKFRIDAGYRTGTLKKPEWKLIKSEYPEIEDNFLIQIMNQQEIFAEKITALFGRKKGRDLFDVWFLINAGLLLDKKLLKNKLSNQKVKINFKNIAQKKEYERDMSRLSTRVIPYEQIIKEIKKMVKEI